MPGETATDSTDGHDGTTERTMAFDCPGCGTENGLYGDPSDFKGRVFECEGCGANVLLNDHKEAPA